MPSTSKNLAPNGTNILVNRFGDVEFALDGVIYVGYGPAMTVTINPVLERLHPEGAPALSRLEAAAWQSADPALLSLCSLAVAHMLKNEPAQQALLPAVDPRKAEAIEQWRQSRHFSAAERAYLAFTEQFVVSVADMPKELVDALLEHSSLSEVHSFVAALNVVEVAQRVDMVANVVLTKEEKTQ